MARRYSSRASRFASVRASNKAKISAKYKKRFSSQIIKDPVTGKELGRGRNIQEARADAKARTSPIVSKQIIPSTKITEQRELKRLISKSKIKIPFGIQSAKDPLTRLILAKQRSRQQSQLQSIRKEPLRINPQTGKPYGTITKSERPKGGTVSEFLSLGKSSAYIKNKRELLRTEKTRSRTGNISPRKEAQLLGLAAVGTVINFGKGIVDLPETAYKIARNPSILRKLPGAIKEGGKEFGTLLRVSPGEAFVKVGTELLLMKGSGVALNKISRTSSSQLAKLNPKYVGEAKIGKTLNIKTGAGKSVNLQVVGKIPKETLASQVGKAGRSVKSAISSQADELLGFIRSRSKTIRKPIPGEADFNTVTKRLLKQFDEGVISKSNLLKLDAAVKKQGAKGLLERSFFADPTGKIRPSRLGVAQDKAASILDYFTGDITFKKAKPQILLFENIKVQTLPKALKTIGGKLKKGAALTKTEADKLLRYQLKKSGKFKPVGFISGESEITLAPGEILKRVKKVGVTVANGKRIPIIKTEVFKPTGKIKSMLSKLNKGTLTKTQTKQLDKLLKKATGFNYGLSSSKKIAGKYVSIKKIGSAILSKLSKKKPRISKAKVIPKYVKPKKTTHKPRKPLPKKPSAKKITSRRKSVSSSPKKAAPKKVSKPKVIKEPVKAKPSVRKRKTKVSRKPPISVRRSRYSPSKSSKSPISRKSPASPRSGKSPVSPRGYKSPASPKYSKAYSPKSPRIGKGIPTKPVKPIKTKKKTKKDSKKKTITGYHVYEKRGKKGYVKLRGLPLTKKQAKDRLASRLDNKISRTAKLVAVKNVKKLGKITKSQVGYFNKYKKNLRNYRIVKGKKVKVPGLFIEKKGSAVISSKGEKRQLALNRKAKAKRTIVKKNTRVSNKVIRSKPKVKINYRRKGAAIVKSRRGILVVSDGRGKYILPGGGANKGERRRAAAIRELREETGLRTKKIKRLGKYKGKPFTSYSGRKIQNLGKVYSIKAKGKARPRSEIKKIAYWKPGSKIKLSTGTRKLINKYTKPKKSIRKIKKTIRKTVRKPTKVRKTARKTVRKTTRKPTKRTTRPTSVKRRTQKPTRRSNSRNKPTRRSNSRNTKRSKKR